MHRSWWNNLFLLILVLANVSSVSANTGGALGADLVFLLDGSRTIGKNNFQKMKEWVATIAELCNISNGLIRIGVVEFSEFNFFGDEQEYISTQIKIGEFSNIDDFKNAMVRIPYFALTTDTAHGLQKALSDLEQSSRFGDPKIAKIIVLITNGDISDKGYLQETLVKLYSEKVIPIVIGVGKSDEDGLRMIANKGVSNEHLNIVSAFSTLDFSLTRSILKSIQDAELQLVLPSVFTTTTDPNHDATSKSPNKKPSSNATSNPNEAETPQAKPLKDSGSKALKTCKCLVTIALLLQATWIFA